jgi:[methyl-Co(III) methanol-specific corrinoid protein]:coenzyme M methyltransferase
MYIQRSLTSKRRLLSAFFDGRVDRIPVASGTSVTTYEQEVKTNAFLPKAHTDGKTLARLAAGCYEILGYDFVYPPLSVIVGAAALGAPINWGDEKKMPNISKPIWKEPEQVRIPPDFLEKPTTRALLEAIGILRCRYGHQVAVFGKVMGPWTLSYHMFGVQETLMASISEPDKLREIMTRLKEVTILFAKAQIAVGADILQISDHTTGDMTGPETYRDMVLPFHQEISQELGCPMVLHICGNCSDRLKYIRESGFDCYHFESKIDARFAVKQMQGKMTLMGNVNNPDVLLKGSPQEVAEAVRYAIEAGVQIVGPECAIPLTTPDENLIEIVKIVKEVSSKKY